MEKSVLKNFVKSTGKHLCHSPFFNKVAGLEPATLLKKRLWYKCFPVNFAKFLRTPFLQNTYGQLLLIFYFFLSNTFAFAKPLLFEEHPAGKFNLKLQATRSPHNFPSIDLFYYQLCLKQHFKQISNKETNQNNLLFHTFIFSEFSSVYTLKLSRI